MPSEKKRCRYSTSLSKLRCGKGCREEKLRVGEANMRDDSALSIDDLEYAGQDVHQGSGAAGLNHEAIIVHEQRQLREDQRIAERIRLHRGNGASSGSQDIRPLVTANSA